ncbi:DUF4192 domain-containing protein [Streptomyces sp. WMMB 322]|uniref:DUF4192 domain-containing protein n=1 Tax=Streptomyces sp. WMMB 322 TaxID=1286821 RepID=UPI00099EDE46|nr:DUF4192 domain-containing protein [Streptomyces sp. WMMB 322]
MTQRDNPHHGHDEESGVRRSDGTVPAPVSRPPGSRSEIALRGPAELADALPYLLGFYPDDSIVVVALHGPRGRFGGRIRIGIPSDRGEWPAVCEQVAACLESEAGSRDRRPEGAIVFLCQDPGPGQKRQEVMEGLRPLAQALRTACGAREIPVYEALCLSGGFHISYCCPDSECCPPGGRPQEEAGTSAMAAAAAYAGIQVRGSLREMERRLTAIGEDAARAQEQALDSASSALVPRILDPDGCPAVRAETLRLAWSLITRFRDALPGEDDAVLADAHDDELLSHDEAAAMILGLQDRRTRDRAAEWMEGADCEPAVRLWRALSRRCVGPYEEHAAAPLTLAGWVSWSAGDGPSARVALDRALRSDPDYVFARLLHRAFNDGVDPEPLRRCMRKERALRQAQENHGTAGPSTCPLP